MTQSEKRIWVWSRTDQDAIEPTNVQNSYRKRDSMYQQKGEVMFINNAISLSSITVLISSHNYNFNYFAVISLSDIQVYRHGLYPILSPPPPLPVNAV